MEFFKQDTHPYILCTSFHFALDLYHVFIDFKKAFDVGFMERIMTDALENYDGTVSIGGRTITNLHFADDIDGLAERKKN